MKVQTEMSHHRQACTTDRRVLNPQEILNFSHVLKLWLLNSLLAALESLSLSETGVFSVEMKFWVTNRAKLLWRKDLAVYFPSGKQPQCLHTGRRKAQAGAVS